MKTDNQLVKESERSLIQEFLKTTSGNIRAKYIHVIIRRDLTFIANEMETKLKNGPFIKERFDFTDEDYCFIGSKADDLGRIEAAMICLLGKKDDDWVFDFLRSMRAVIGDKGLITMFNIPMNISLN